MRQLTGKRVLAVEDEALIAMVIEDTVAELGGYCAVASDVAAALALMDAETFDAALLDLNLKGETSTAVAERLRGAGIPYAYATGSGGAAIDAAGGRILAKPYVQEELTRTLLRLFSD